MGVISMLVAYFLSQSGALSIRSPKYLWMNMLGALGVVFSLHWDWNFPAFLIESAWAAVSGYGILKSRKR